MKELGNPKDKSLPEVLNKLDKPWIWGLFLLLIYAWSAGPFLWNGTVFNYYSWQANAWLKGYLWLPNVTDNKLDLTPFGGHWYSAFPPVLATTVILHNLAHFQPHQATLS